MDEARLRGARRRRLSRPYENSIENYSFQKRVTNDILSTGIKEYSDWPTIPQLYINKEFVGGCDVLMSMHQDGSLAKMLEENNLLAAGGEDASSS